MNGRQDVSEGDVPHILHVFPSFSHGGYPIRMAAVLNHLGVGFKHKIISLNGSLDSRNRLDRHLNVSFGKPEELPRAMICRTFVAARRIAHIRPRMLVTYNWGSMEWAFAHTLRPVAVHLHFESGFGPEESDRQLWRRVAFRRLALRGCRCVVVPSQALEQYAAEDWSVPATRVLRIPNGVDCDRFSPRLRHPAPMQDRNRRSPVRELVVGSTSPLRREKNLPRLIRVFSMLKHRSKARLCLVGDGPERAVLVRAAEQLGMQDQLQILGHTDSVEEALRTFDIFALSSDTEQLPNGLLQAMAAGLPIVSTDVGDVRATVTAGNQPYIVPKLDERAFADAIDDLLQDSGKRIELGLHNRARAEAEFGIQQMLHSYEKLFRETLSACRS